MPTPNDRDFNRETTRREVYRDPQGNTHVNQSTHSVDPVYPPGNSDPRPLSEQSVPPVDPRDPRPLADRTAYRAGYANGQLVENRLRQDEEERRLMAENQVVRDNDNAARGLLLGILLTSLVGLAIGAFALLNRQQSAPVAPVIVPNNSTAPAPSPATNSPAPAATSPTASPAAPNRETTVIERTTQVVPVPQQRTIERVVVPAPSPQAPAPAASPTSPLPQGTIVVPSPTTPATQSPTVVPGGNGTGTTPTNGTTGQ